MLEMLIVALRVMVFCDVDAADVRQTITFGFVLALAGTARPVMMVWRVES